MSTQIIILATLIVLSAIFSGSETALVSVTKSKVDQLVAEKKRNSTLLKKMKQDPHKLLITVLIGNNIVNIGASAYAAILFTDIFGSSGVGIATGLMTFLILIFGEITPKSFCHQHSVGVSLFIAKPIYVLQILFWPFVWLFEQVVKLVNIIFGSKTGYTVTEGELVAMLKIGAEEGSIEKQEKELIENVLEFNDIMVEEVMTPRVKIDALDEEMTIQEAVNYAIKHTHSRIPIYRENLDSIIGIISIKELLQYFDRHNGSKKLKKLDFPIPMEVPLSKKINVLFREFQKQHQHIAVVIDEYGGTGGLVTLEDLLEEIVGEIVDETDPHEKILEVINKNTVIANGSAEIEMINDFFRIKFWDEEHDTINTVIMEYLHRFPREGEVVHFPRLKIEISQMKGNIVEKVKITKKRRLNLKP
ncbi:hemolysin family protein [Patescibacteria group bacterium]